LPRPAIAHSITKMIKAFKTVLPLNLVTPVNRNKSPRNNIIPWNIEV